VAQPATVITAKATKKYFLMTINFPLFHSN
jgi:hypothetical protein